VWALLFSSGGPCNFLRKFRSSSVKFLPIFERMSGVGKIDSHVAIALTPFVTSVQSKSLLRCASECKLPRCGHSLSDEWGQDQKHATGLIREVDRDLPLDAALNRYGERPPEHSLP